MPGREQILAEFRRILTEAEALMPQYFSRRPQGSLQVLRVPEALQAGAAGASYYGGALDGSRPGTFYVNLRSVAEQPRYKMKTLAYHEGVPGHHFQIELAMRMKGMPLLRQQGIFNVYTEGWALYAEQLMADIGMYEDDPLGDLGRLSDEMLRAVRLVVDTGIHAQGWTRARAIAYMMEKSGLVESDATGEIDRYIAMPAQACSYKIGQLKILELRERARSKLGERFDLRAFHDVVLERRCALPLTALEQLVDEWIAAQQAAGAKPPPQRRSAEDSRRVEYRPVHAHPLHRRARGRLHLDGAAGAAADRAGHVFLERDLAGQVELAGQRSHGLQHRRRVRR